MSLSGKDILGRVEEIERQIQRAASFIGKTHNPFPDDPVEYEREGLERLAPLIPELFVVSEENMLALLSVLVFRASRGVAQKRKMEVYNSWRDAD